MYNQTTKTPNSANSIHKKIRMGFSWKPVRWGVLAGLTDQNIYFQKAMINNIFLILMIIISDGKGQIQGAQLVQL